MKRRTLLLLAPASAAIAAGFWRLKDLLWQPNTPDAVLLTAFLDTLFPADGEWPAASALDMEKELERSFAHRPHQAKKVARLLEVLDRHSRQMTNLGFAHHSLEERERLIETLLEEKGDLAMSFVGLRALAFQIYYSHPTVWSSLPDYHPPQPLGYPDYQQPPAHV